MNIKYFYYISSGELNRMYTLRVSYTEIVGSGEHSYAVIRDHYCCNLSTDKVKAYEKAKERVANKTYGSCTLVDQDKVPTLEDIYRRNEAEMEEARRLAAETSKRDAEAFEERCYQSSVDKINKIAAGIWPFGKYLEVSFGQELGKNEPDYGYIRFFLNIQPDDEDNTDKHHMSVLTSLQNALRQRFSWILELPVPNDALYGEIKSRETFQLTLIDTFEFFSSFGWQQIRVIIQKFVKDTGECIIYKGSSPVSCKLGETVKVIGTIKEHSEYRGQNQTIIQRPKILGE